MGKLIIHKLIIHKFENKERLVIAITFLNFLILVPLFFIVSNISI